jgi:hypothetical protein
MTDLNFLAGIAADLNAGIAALDKVLGAYEKRLVTAHDTLVANGLNVQSLRDKGEARDTWLAGLASAYLTKREFATWSKDGALRSKELEAAGNTQGLTEKGKLNNRVSKRSTDILSGLDKVFAAEGKTGEEKVAAKKGPNANEARSLPTRIQEECSKLIKAVEKEAKAEKPELKKHGAVKAILEKAAADIAALQK